MYPSRTFSRACRLNFTRACIFLLGKTQFMLDRGRRLNYKLVTVIKIVNWQFGSCLPFIKIILHFIVHRWHSEMKKTLGKISLQKSLEIMWVLDNKWNSKLQMNWISVPWNEFEQFESKVTLVYKKITKVFFYYVYILQIKSEILLYH